MLPASHEQYIGEKPPQSSSQVKKNGFQLALESLRDKSASNPILAQGVKLEG